MEPSQRPPGPPREPWSVFEGAQEAPEGAKRLPGSPFLRVIWSHFGGQFRDNLHIEFDEDFAYVCSIMFKVSRENTMNTREKTMK